MKKKIIIIVMPILFVLGIYFYYKYNFEGIKQHVDPIHSAMKSEEKEKVVYNEEKVDITNSEEPPHEEIREAIKEEKVETKNTSKEEPTKTDSNKTTSSSKSTPKNNTTSNSNNSGGETNSNTTPKKEEKPVVVQKQPWEELGLTEDQYKNQPMYSWEEVDFNTKEECMNYGNEHAEYGFECSEVTSWTRSLGWDYKTF